MEITSPVPDCNSPDRYQMFKPNIKRTGLLPGICVAVVTERIPNADLSSIDSIMATILSIGDGDSVDFIQLLEIQSPPWFEILLCVGTGSLSPVASTIPINGPFRHSFPKQCRLSHFSTSGNIRTWTKFIFLKYKIV